MDENDSIWIYNCDKLEKELLFKRDTIQNENMGQGIVSPAARYVLIPVIKEKVGRQPLIGLNGERKPPTMFVCF